VPAAGQDLSAPRFQLQILHPEGMFMARRFLILLGFFFLFSVSAKAQGGADLFAGFSYEHLGTSPARNLGGVEVTGQYKFTDWFGIAADLDAQFGLPSQPDGRTIHFMAGPQLSFPTRISPFFHVLAGVGHASDNGLISTSFSGAIGGGINMRVAPLISWRIVQVDDVITRFYGTVEHSPRISTGFVFRF
jgi:hypothetical protein